ncbi:hypothetical protein J8631_26695 [Serratia fonticola]|uniref:hypothetical protein n=1 Tax=Serratia fonticola TaxID=47917 RepID=UPI001AE74A60|nr:hypothetical protein [Serratia fonticola]MBP1039148.1 hypothetical protein [Serratia fonticola]
MNAETNQTINHLRNEIKHLKEQVTALQYRADSSFAEMTAIFLTLTVTAGALDNATKDRGKYLFSTIKETFVDAASNDEDREIRREILSTAGGYVSKFLAKVE